MAAFEPGDVRAADLPNSTRGIGSGERLELAAVLVNPCERAEINVK
jgi:hypothetical protein